MAFVQATKSADTNDGSASTVATAAFASTPGAGNAITGHVSWLGGLNDLTSVTDGTNTYSIVDRWQVSSPDSVYMATFVAQNIGGAGALTVTGNFSPSTTFRRIFAQEWDGVATTGQPNAHSKSADNAGSWGTGTDAVTSGNGTTTVDGCTIVGAAYDEAASDSPAVGTGYTSRDSATFSAGDGVRVESKTQSTQGAVAATFTTTFGTSRIAAGMIALAPAAAGAALLETEWYPTEPQGGPLNVSVWG